MKIAFVSYPRSGRNWVRFMVDHYLQALWNVDYPTVYGVETHPDYPFFWTHAGAAMEHQVPHWALSERFRSRLIEERAHSATWFNLSGVIVLVRKLQGIIASAYPWCEHYYRIFSGTLEQFIYDPRFGAPKAIAWHQMMEWELPRIDPHLAIYTYCGVHENPMDNLVNILSKAGVHINRDLLALAIEAGQFENMQQLAMSETYMAHPAPHNIRPVDPSDPRTYVVRQGKVDGWKNEISEAERAILETFEQTIPRGPLTYYL